MTANRFFGIANKRMFDNIVVTKFCLTKYNSVLPVDFHVYTKKRNALTNICRKRNRKHWPKVIVTTSTEIFCTTALACIKN